MSKLDAELTKVRLDKWLWAARFYKTRSIAKAMIEGGKVHVDGQRVKPSREIMTGVTIRLRQGFDEKTVAVTALSDRRGNATAAAHLYVETPDSQAKRAETAALRKAAGTQGVPEQRPTKKERRQIMRLQQQPTDD